MLKKIIALLVAIVIFGVGIYLHIEPLSGLYALVALVALMISITFRAHGYKMMFSIVGLVHFAYLIRYIWLFLGPWIQSVLP